jgi:hypothetical protein
MVEHGASASTEEAVPAGTRVPTWTVVIAAIFGGAGVAVSLLMFFNPAAAPVIGEIELTPELRPMIVSYAIRNSITALVILIAVWLRTPAALFAAVSGRLLTELMDGAKVLAAGASANLVIVVVLMVAAGLVLWKLWPLVRIEMAAARAQGGT